MEPDESFFPESCDRCIARAYVKITTGSGILLFCGHHYVVHQPAIEKRQYPVVDMRNNIGKRLNYIDIWGN